MVLWELWGLCGLWELCRKISLFKIIKNLKSMQTNCKNKMTTFFKPNCNVDCDCSNCQEGKIPTIMIRINNNSSTLKCLNYLSLRDYF